MDFYLESPIRKIVLLAYPNKSSSCCLDASQNVDKIKHLEWPNITGFLHLD